MKIGFVADTHVHLENARRAAALLRDARVQRVFHLGDITIPHVIQLFEGFEMTYVSGDGDRDPAALEQTLLKVANQQQLFFSFFTTLDEVRIALTHGDTEDLPTFIASGQYDLVVHGHTHHRRDEMIGATRVLNPGSLGGSFRSSHSFCIFDTRTAAVNFIEVEVD